jgi:two-component system chemotaxis response regulator CheB
MRQLVVVGASAGGVEALVRLTSLLPRTLQATVCIVVHFPPRSQSRLPDILGRRTALSVAHASDGERITRGTIRIAPPDHHLVVDDGHLRLSSGPQENRHRPAIDVLFRSAAASYGDRVSGVLLSGGPGDGVAGLSAIQRAGGLVLVQDPQDAVVASLPESALEVITADHVATADALGPLLARAASGAGDDGLTPVRRIQGRPEMQPIEAIDNGSTKPSVYGCPDCGGVLWEVEEGQLLRFRCRTGHAFGPDGVLDAKAESVETALWTAIVNLEERSSLTARLAARARNSGLADSAAHYEAASAEMTRRAESIREVLGPTVSISIDAAGDPLAARAAAAE